MTPTVFPQSAYTIFLRLMYSASFSLLFLIPEPFHLSVSRRKSFIEVTPPQKVLTEAPSVCGILSKSSRLFDLPATNARELSKASIALPSPETSVVEYTEEVLILLSEVTIEPTGAVSNSCLQSALFGFAVIVW